MPAEHGLERDEGREDGVLPRVVAHRADAPDLAVQGPEGRADLDAEVVEHVLPGGVARDALWDDDGDDVVHLVSDVAEDLEAEGLHAGEHRCTCELVAVDDVVAPLTQQHGRALSRRVEHGGGLGVVIESARAPVVEDHAEVEVVGADEVAR